MPNATTKTEIDPFVREIEAFAHVRENIEPAAAVTLWRRFIATCSSNFLNLKKAILAMRLFWQPGDIKLTLRRIDADMPGFLPWVSGARYAKAEYPKLYEAIGRDDPDNPDFFLMPDIDSRQLAAIHFFEGGRKPGDVTEYTVDAGASTVSVVYVALWVKY